MAEQNICITGKGIVAVHMMPHVRPAEEPWNSIAEDIGKDIDALQMELAKERAEYDVIEGWAKQAGVDVSRASGATMIERAIDMENARWQEAIDEVVCDIDPDRDGSGCDSGDPLDLTLTELNGAIRKMREAAATLTAERDAMREAVENLLSGLMMDYPLVAIGMNNWGPVVAARAALGAARRSNA